MSCNEAKAKNIKHFFLFDQTRIRGKIIWHDYFYFALTLNLKLLLELFIKSTILKLLILFGRELTCKKRGCLFQLSEDQITE